MDFDVLALDGRPPDRPDEPIDRIVVERLGEELETWKRTMWVLWFSVFFCSGSFTMAIPFIPLYLLELGAEDVSVNLWAGVINASGFLVGAVMAPIWGSLADKYGKKKMVVRAGFGVGAAYFLFSLVGSPLELLAVRILHGFSAGFIPASLSIVASVAPSNRMGRSLGTMQSATISGTVFGPLMGGVLSELFGIRMSYLVAGSIMLVVVSFVIMLVKEGKQGASSAKPNLLRDFRFVWHHKVLFVLLTMSFLFHMSSSMMQTFMSLHVARLWGDYQSAAFISGIVLGMVGLAGMLAAPIWGRTGETRGFPNILLVCLSVAGSVAFLQSFVPNLWIFGTGQFVYGLFMAGIAPALNTLMVQNTGAGFRGRSFGLSSSANQFGSMTGPLFGGVLSFFLNTHWIFAAAGSILLLAGLMAYLRFFTGTPQSQQTGLPKEG